MLRPDSFGIGVCGQRLDAFPLYRQHQALAILSEPLTPILVPKSFTEILKIFSKAFKCF